ncbi:hypothetical protein [Legionella waltersii]|uniref:Dot/Icm T4SS effector n=1 Tax=Legionella waltersii TaxID=66969 RepID=A0A0W1A597_9GAMM|nr:hypothetical protein [Legionella waltersii]KTD76535.1 Dot/Icm T4SS effector [Legionella waltersii]SNU93994.1 Dot/Icm T4SS effector [Legionella waltersii]
MFSKFTLFKGAMKGIAFRQPMTKFAYSTTKMNFGLKETFFNYSEKLIRITNPTIGKDMLKLESSGVFLRVDGRDPSVFHKEGGLKPRVDKKHLDALTFDDVVQYQRFNQNPFGWGTCKTFEELAVFIRNNQSHVDSKWIFAFYGKGTSLLELKFHTGIESDGYDIEAEHIVFSHVPFDNMLAATCPKYRTKFMEDMLVPNALHDFNQSLPKVLRKEDISSSKNVLSWLLKHNSEDAFISVCTHLYRGKSEDTLTMMLEGDKFLVAAVKTALKKAEQNQELRMDM